MFTVAEKQFRIDLGGEPIIARTYGGSPKRRGVGPTKQYQARPAVFEAVAI